MSRFCPLSHLTVQQLEAYYENWKGDPNKLAVLKRELSHRNSRRSKKLHLQTLTDGVESGNEQNPSLLGNPIFPPDQAPPQTNLQGFSSDDILELSDFLEFLDSKECNWILNPLGERGDKFPFLGLAEYLRSEPTERIQELASLEGMGLKYANEFEHRLQDFLITLLGQLNNLFGLASEHFENLDEQAEAEEEHSLERFIEYIESRANVRLINGLKLAGWTNAYPLSDMDSYLAQGKTRRIELLNTLPNIGKKTAIEFDALAKSFYAQSKSQIETRPVPRETFRNVTVRSGRRFWYGDFMSFIGDQGSEQVVYFVRAHEIEPEHLIGLIGDTARLSPEDRMVEYQEIFPYMDPESVHEFDHLVESFLDGKKSVEYLRSDPLSHESLLTKLDTREEEIIRRRYGLGVPAETLDSVGESFEVTRERVRQLAQKALKKLQASANRPYWQKLMPRIEQAICDDLFGFSPAISPPKLKSGLTKFLADVFCNGVSVFLTVNATKWRGKWVSNSVDTASLEVTFTNLSELLDSVQLPIALNTLATKLGVGSSEIDTCLSVLPNFTAIKGYVFQGNSSPRRKRLANVLQLNDLGEIPKLISLWDLKVVYRKRFLDDECSGRDLRLILEENKHIFLNLRELGWYRIDGPVSQIFSGEQDFGKPNPDDTYLYGERPSPNETGLVNSAYALLEKEGPLHLGDALKVFADRYPGYSRSSLGPILISYPVFVRLAPGVFGLQKHLVEESTLNSAYDVITTEHHIKIYILSRLTGSPFISYPLWGKQIERKWCEWLREKAKTDLLWHLLKVVNPQSWDIERSEINFWLQLKSVGVGRIKAPDVNISSKHIFPSHCLYALLAASLSGRTNWMHINHALGWRVDTASRVALVIAALVHLGYLKASSHWNLGHELTDRGKSALDEWLVARSDRVQSLDAIERRLLHMSTIPTHDLGWTERFSSVDIFTRIRFSANDAVGEVESADEDEVIDAIGAGSLHDWLNS